MTYGNSGRHYKIEPHDWESEIQSERSVPMHELSIDVEDRQTFEDDRAKGGAEEVNSKPLIHTSVCAIFLVCHMRWVRMGRVLSAQLVALRAWRERACLSFLSSSSFLRYIFIVLKCDLHVKRSSYMFQGQLSAVGLHVS